LTATLALLKAKVDADLSFQKIAEYLNKSEDWVVQVFLGLQFCSSTEAEKLAEIMDVDALLLLSEIGGKPKESSFLKVFFLQVIDKVVIGTIALIIALSVQHKYQEFSLKREKAIAVSNLNSSFLNSHYKQLEEKYFELMLLTDDIIRSLKINPAHRNKPENKNSARNVEVLSQYIESIIDVISRSSEDKEITGKALNKSIKLFTSSLITLNLEPDIGTRKQQLQKDFSGYSTAIQNALIQIVNSEIDTVLQ
jgi:hypothetical protein